MLPLIYTIVLPTHETFL